MTSAPIAFFAYKRPEHTLRSLQSLAQNEGADRSQLFIFCDGAKSDLDQASVAQVRAVVRQQQWCGEVHILERDQNWGLANSIIAGVTELCDRFGQVIVLEDDLVLSPQFLNYMNDALNYYRHQPRVMHISGYMWPLPMALPETLFLGNAACWGWATWQRAWQQFHPDADHLFEQIKTQQLQTEFSFAEARPYWKLLRRQKRGKVDSWAIRWYASVFLQRGLSLYPGRSLVCNIGHDGTGSSHATTSIFQVHPSDQRVTQFTDQIEENPAVRQAFIDYFHSLKSSAISA